MCLHRNHIYKMVKAISSDKKSYFIYTGVYLKKIDEFNNTLSYSPYSFCEIDNDDLCSFTILNDIDENFLFNIEERFAFSCCLFKRNLLNFTKDFEFAQINYAVHLYLALLFALIKWDIFYIQFHAVINCRTIKLYKICFIKKDFIIILIKEQREPFIKIFT